VGSTLAKHYNGSAWSSPAIVPAGVLLNVVDLGINDVWATGEGAKLRHYIGNASWETGVEPVVGVDTDYALAWAGATLWISTAADAARQEGNTWVPYTPPGGATWLWMYAPSTNDVWGVGPNTKVGHWTGSTWDVQVPIAGGYTMYGVHGAGT